MVAQCLAWVQLPCQDDDAQLKVQGHNERLKSIGTDRLCLVYGWSYTFFFHPGLSAGLTERLKMKVKVNCEIQIQFKVKVQEEIKSTD